MIDIRHVYQTFGDRHILKDVSLSIKEGETMVILGASGSGKSTLLKLIIGLFRPTSGKVLVNGKDMGQLSEEELNEERRSMGMVFQYSALFDSLNVKENVAFWSAYAHAAFGRRDRCHCEGEAASGRA